jgi:hypothetical protein
MARGTVSYHNLVTPKGTRPAHLVDTIREVL